MRRSPLALVAFVAVVLSAALAGAGCGAGPGTNLPPPTTIVRRPLPDAMKVRRAIAYSGYREGENPDLQKYPSEAEIQQDLELLVRGGWGLIRLFDTGPHAERVLKVIRDRHLDLQVMLGVWISGAKAAHDAENQDQIRRCVALVTQYDDLVAAISVGNETLDDWSNVRTPPADLAAYITQVRGLVRQPVTTDDSWLPFMLGMDGATDYADVIQVARAADFLSLHVYAFADAFYESWPWQQLEVAEADRAMAMMDAAIAYSKEAVRGVRETMLAQNLDIPLVIGEWGWKSATSADANSLPERKIERWFAHPVNQKIFYDAIVDWVYGQAKDADSPAIAFYFEAFDEPWKDIDDNWGLFDVTRTPKYVVWEQFPELKPANAPAYSTKDAVYYKP
jgi:exo-beta-1,3-glucanase (GH17 family)